MENCDEDALPKHVDTIAKVFKNGGYATSFIGKWHLGDEGNKPIPAELRGDFEYFIGYQIYNGFKENVCFYNENNEEIKFNGHRTDVTTKIAIDRLKMLHNDGRPFLNVISYQAPHYPVQPSPQYESIYSELNIPYDPDYSEVEPYTPTLTPYSPRPFEDCSDYIKYGGNMQKYLQLYYAMVSQIDAGVGEIIKTIDDMGIRDETVIVFTSDHGDMQGSHGKKNKMLPYEKSCGIPLIISVPGGRKNEISDALVSGIDLFPTFLEYAGLPMVNGLQGKSIAPYTMGEPQTFSSPVFSEAFSQDNRELNWKMVRLGKYKLTVYADTMQPYLLFDMEKDPFEMDNLVAVPKYQDIVRSLRNLIIDLFQ